MNAATTQRAKGNNMDDDDFLAAVEADNASNAAPEPIPVEVVAPEPEQPAAEPAPNSQQAGGELVLDTPVEAPKPAEPGFVPIAAMLDARDRAKAAEARLAEMEARQVQQQQSFQMPDPYEDPEGFAAAQEAKVGQALYQTNLRWSERIATIQHGEETVNAAKQWGFTKCDSDPYFNARVAASPDPLGLVVSEYKREEIASKVTPDDFAQFQAWKAAQTQLTTQPPPQGASPASSAIPPRSLASAPSAGSILTEPEQSDEDVFKETFKR